MFIDIFSFVLGTSAVYLNLESFQTDDCCQIPAQRSFATYLEFTILRVVLLSITRKLNVVELDGCPVRC